MAHESLRPAAYCTNQKHQLAEHRLLGDALRRLVSLAHRGLRVSRMSAPFSYQTYPQAIHISTYSRACSYLFEYLNYPKF
jgi:hypothetical protein